jgi:hypothetical protein
MKPLKQILTIILTLNAYSGFGQKPVDTTAIESCKIEIYPVEKGLMSLAYAPLAFGSGLRCH